MILEGGVVHYRPSKIEYWPDILNIGPSVARDNIENGGPIFNFAGTIMNNTARQNHVITIITTFTFFIKRSTKGKAYVE